MKKFLIALLSAFLLSCCGHSSFFNAPSSVTAKTVHKSVGKLTAYKVRLDLDGEKQYFPIGGGTGFAIGRNEIMTANHVCEILDEPNTVMKLSYYNGTSEVKYKTDLIPIKRHKQSDLCILFMYNNPLKAIKFSDDAPKIGDRVYVFGMPAHVAFVLTTGFYGQHIAIRVSGIGTLVGAAMSVPTYPGNSGSPVLNQDGEFIGVLSAGFIEYHHVTFTPSYFSIYRFLKDRGY